MLKFEENFPMSQITTLQIGGPARLFVIVESEQDLIEAIQYANQNRLPYLVIGGGSNLLVTDEGLNKLIIKNDIEGIIKHVRWLKVKSGTSLQHLVDYSIAHHLSGLQRLTGIPGTLGGAVFGNAGAYGQTISDYIRDVICLDPSSGELITLQQDECEFDYRDSIFKRNGFTFLPQAKGKHLTSTSYNLSERSAKQVLIILEIVFKLEVGKSQELRKEADEVLEKRLVKYPKGIKCPGSFFKNLVVDKVSKEILSKVPKEKIVYGKIPAGALLEMVGAKGDRLGDIEIADYHANLFINKGKGKALDFYTLAKKYALKVKNKFGIILEPEVQLINLPSLI